MDEQKNVRPTAEGGPRRRETGMNLNELNIRFFRVYYTFINKLPPVSLPWQRLPRPTWLDEDHRRRPFEY